MRQFISKNKKWFGYVLYCIILTVGLLYYRFPSDALKDYFKITANNLNTPLLISIDQIRPWLPFGLKLKETEISLKDKPTMKLFRADSLLVSPELWSLLKGKIRYCFKCTAYGGDVRGCVYFSKNSKTAPFSMEIEVKNVQIGNYEYIKDLVDRRINGSLYGTMYYRGQQRNLMGGNGGANLKLLNGRVELLLPLLGLDSIRFNEIMIDMVLKKQKINLARFDLIGPHLKGTLSGNVSLKKQVARSTLDLKGTIEPFAAFFKSAEGVSNVMSILKQRLKKGTLNFVIRGTLREPKVKFT